MMKETCRQKVVNKFLLEISDDKKSDVVSDMVRHLCHLSLIVLYIPQNSRVILDIQS